jgi:hypothetical protein
VSEDIRGGRVVLDVVADSSRLEPDLREDVRRAQARVRARVQVEVDAERARVELERLAAERRVASVRAEADVARAQADLDRVAAGRRVAEIRAEADVARARADLDRAANARVAEVRAEADVARAQTDLDRVTQRRRVAEIRAEADAAAAQARLDRVADQRRVAEIRLEADVAAAQARLDRVADQRRVAEVRAEADVARAQADLDRVARQRRIADIRAEADVATARARLDRVADQQRVATVRVEADIAAAQERIDRVADQRRISEIEVQARTDRARIDLDRLEQQRRLAEIRADAQVGEAAERLRLLTEQTRIARIRADAQTQEAAERLARLAAERRRAEIRADLEDQLARRRLQQLTRTRTVQIIARIGSAGTAVGSLTIFPGIAAGITLAAGALTQVAAGLVAVVGAAAPAVGVLGAIPGLLGAITQGIGGVVVGFSGVGDAVKAVGQAQAAAGAAAAAGGAQQEAAAARIAAAKDRIQQTTEALMWAEREAAQQVADAQQSVADAHERAARDVAQAERTLIDSQREAVAAQQDLNAARQQAIRDLQDMESAAANGRLSVEQAQISLERAGLARDQTNADETSTGLDRHQADLDFREAQQRLKDAQTQQRRLEDDAAKGRKAGVEGSDAVTRARQRLEEANRKVADSEAELRRAQVDGARDVARAQVMLGRAISSSSRTVTQAQHALLLAQRDLADAQASATATTAGQTAAQTALATAMGKLSPAGRRFVRFLTGTLVPAWGSVKKAVQESLLPPVQAGLTALLPLMGVFGRGLATAAGTIGQAFRDLAVNYLATPVFKDRFAQVLANNTTTLGIFAQAFEPLIRLFIALSLAAQPMIERFATFTTTTLDAWAAMAEGGEASGRLQAAFKTAGDALALLGSILSNTGRALFNLGKAGFDSGQRILLSIDAAADRWADWTESIEGQNAMADYFDKAEPTLRATARLLHDLGMVFIRLGDDETLTVLIEQIRTEMLPSVERIAVALNSTLGPALIQLFTDLFDLIADISEAGGGGFAAFINTLDRMIVTLDRLVSNPTIGPFIQALLKIAGVAAAFALLGGVIGKIISPLLFVFRILGPLLLRFALMQRLLGALRLAFLAVGRAILGPWGLAIIAIVAGLVLAYNKVDWFHDFVDATFRLIGQAATWLWERGIKPAFSAISTFITQTLIPTISRFWTFVVRPTFTAIGSFIAWWWDHVTKPVFAALVWYFRVVVGPVFAWLWTHIVRPTFSAIGSFVGWWWTNVVKPVFAGVVWFIQKVLGPVIAWLYNNVIKPYFRNMGLAIQATWTNVIRPAFDALKKAVLLVRDAFSTAITGIGKIWNGLKKIASDPVAFVVNTVYNKGIRGVWNKIAKLVGLPELPPFAYSTPTAPKPSGSTGGGRTVAFARGGVVPGYAPGVDSVPAMVSPGEGWLVPEAVRGLARTMGTTAKDAIQAINAAFSGRVSAPSRRRGDSGHYTLGGLVDRAKSVAERARTVGAWAKEGIQGVAGKIGGITLGTLAKGASAAFSPLRTLVTRALGTTPPWTFALNKAVNKILGGVVKTAGAKDAVAGLVGGGFGLGGTWPPAQAGVLSSNTAAAVNFIRSTWEQITSIGTLGSRPNKSDHPMGKALDAMIPGWSQSSGVALGNAIASWFTGHASTFGTKYVIWRDRINTGSGWRPYTHPNGPTDNPTLQHRDHVHVSLLDQGGYLQPGTTMVRNETGRVEPVLNPGQWAMFQRSLALVERLAASAPARATLATIPAQPTAGRGVTIEQLIVKGSDDMSMEELARLVAVELGWLVRA